MGGEMRIEWYMRYKLAKMLALTIIMAFFCIDIDAKKDVISSTKYDIEGYETGTQGTYLVKVYVYSKKGNVSTEEFKFAAVHGVIFRGFAGKGFSNQKSMASPETETQNSDYYSSFFNNGDYLAYAEVVTPNADRVKIGKEYKVAAIVSVQKDNLRKTLEKAGVIRGLNSGF